MYNPGIDVQPRAEQLNGVHINGDATVEEQLADLEDGECDACTI